MSSASTLAAQPSQSAQSVIDCQRSSGQHERVARVGPGDRLDPVDVADRAVGQVGGRVHDLGELVGLLQVCHHARRVAASWAGSSGSPARAKAMIAGGASHFSLWHGAVSSVGPSIQPHIYT